ncbi:hypothetical protein C8T65DRAFT_740677 [Cerioporus squamosus]|nr:hypothetical protein C8T65DRAFT_740677 [Cerioporus squamosus]
MDVDHTTARPQTSRILPSKFAAWQVASEEELRRQATCIPVKSKSKTGNLFLPQPARPPTTSPGSWPTAQWHSMQFWGGRARPFVRAANFHGAARACVARPPSPAPPPSACQCLRLPKTENAALEASFRANVPTIGNHGMVLGAPILLLRMRAPSTPGPSLLLGGRAPVQGAVALMIQ